MSRRCHHGSPRHARAAARERRRGSVLADRAAPPNPATEVTPSEPEISVGPSVLDIGSVDDLAVDDLATETVGLAHVAADLDVAEEAPASAPPPLEQPAAPVVESRLMAPRLPAVATTPERRRFRPGVPEPGSPDRDATDRGTAVRGSLEHGATAPQLRRFIKSRAYVPMHELRRRFAINGGDDDVTALEVDRQRVYVGLPEREGRLLGELLKGGDIGVELSLDPIAPIVVGVFPMRPIPRT
jgi:hypothetical protein